MRINVESESKYNYTAQHSNLFQNISSNHHQLLPATWPWIWLQSRSSACPRCETPHRLQLKFHLVVVARYGFFQIRTGHIPALSFRCIAIVSPLKRMEWMTARAAKRKIIPLVILASLGYVSFRCLTVVKADPGILACDAVSGTSLVVRHSLHY